MVYMEKFSITLFLIGIDVAATVTKVDGDRSESSVSERYRRDHQSSEDI